MDSIVDVMKETFNLSEIPKDASKQNIPEWDSIGHLNLILNIEQKFNMKFLTKEIPHLDSLEKISIKIREKHGRNYSF